MFEAVITFRRAKRRLFVLHVLLLIARKTEARRERSHLEPVERTFGNLVGTRKNITRDENLYGAVIKCFLFSPRSMRAA
jgi:hypothetical protein